MPVFMVSVNAYDSSGRKRPMPELVGIAPTRDRQDAVVKTLDGESFFVRDVDVELLTDSNACWYVDGPETRQ